MNAAYLEQLKRFTYKKLSDMNEEEKEDIRQEAYLFGIEKNGLTSSSYMTSVIEFKGREARRDKAIWFKQESLIHWYFASSIYPNLGYIRDYRQAVEFLQGYSDRHLTGATKIIFDRCFLQQEDLVEVAKELNKKAHCTRNLMYAAIKKCKQNKLADTYIQIIIDMQKGSYYQ